MIAIVVVNAFVAHYRDAYERLGDAVVLAEVRAHLFAAPADLARLQSWLLFLLGLGFAALGFAKGYRLDDPYPGYGAVDRRRAGRDLTPPPSVRRRGRGGRDALTMVAVIGATLLLLGGGTAAYFLTRSDSVDAAFLCPRSGPAAVHSVLIDRSDPISPLQAARVRQVLDAAVFEAAPGTLLALYSAESEGVAALAPVLALCNPGRDANPLYHNPCMIRERYERDFKARLDSAVASLLAPSTRQTSPIMESLKAVSVDAFGSAPAGVPLRLIIVSDMLQHSQLVSHYRERDFEALLRSPRLQTLRADCRGADVDIVYLLRPTRTGQPGVQTRAHQSFWNRYLQLMNARPRRMEPI